MAMSIPSLTQSANRSDVATRTSISPWTRRNRNSLGMSHLAANESIVLTLTIPEACPVAADVAAARSFYPKELLNPEWYSQYWFLVEGNWSLKTEIPVSVRRPPQMRGGRVAYLGPFPYASSIVMVIRRFCAVLTILAAEVLEASEGAGVSCCIIRKRSR